MGDKCSIGTGKPSEERTLLLRREALELALYTFRYAKDVKQVIAILPPPPKKDPSAGDVLPPRRRAARSSRSRCAPRCRRRRRRSARCAREPTHDYLNKLTDPGFYFFGVQQAQDANFLLILSHSPPQPASSSSSSGPSS